jgi:hypothetical protein
LYAVLVLDIDLDLALDFELGSVLDQRTNVSESEESEN